MANAYTLPRMCTTSAAYNTSVDVRQCRDYLATHHVRRGCRITSESIRGLSTRLRSPKTLYERADSRLLNVLTRSCRCCFNRTFALSLRILLGKPLSRRWRENERSGRARAYPDDRSLHREKYCEMMLNNNYANVNTTCCDYN